ncbi:MAG: tetratricopeptide repeat protein [Thermoproteota archaeon]|nr:tetratricopeptide repeat protein [Thermoproteota archaeon]
MTPFLAVVAVSIAGIAYWAIITTAIISNVIYSPNYSIPQTVATKRASYYTALLAKGDNFISLKQYKESIAYFDKALAVYPNSS